MWLKAPEFGVDFAKLVHYEQAAQFHAALPPEGEVAATARVAEVRDRGEGKGALVVRGARNSRRKFASALLHAATDAAVARRRRLRRRAGAASTFVDPRATAGYDGGVCDRSLAPR